MTATVPLATCPDCAEPTVTTGLGRPWCPACDWNLGQAGPATFGWRWIDRRLHRVTVRMNAAQFAALADGPLTPGTMTAARLTTVAAAVVLLAGVLAIAVLGVWLVVFDFFSVSTVLGLLLLGVAFVLRPRLGRLSALTDDRARLEPARAPQLFALVQRVAAAIGAPAPQAVILGYDLNAFTTTVGLRRTRVLALGLPLWATLEPQEWVALLGHELGHFVNGDVRRGPLTQIAETTLVRVGHLFDTDGPSYGGIVGTITTIITRALEWLVSTTARALALLLVWTSRRDSQGAEYLADEMGARAGGSDAAIGLADHLVIMESIDTVVRREARAGNGMPAWHEAARVARANLAPSLPVLRRLTRHTEASLTATHPPAGLRAEMLERRPRLAAAVTLTETAAEDIDRELAGYQKRAVRELKE